MHTFNYMSNINIALGTNDSENLLSKKILETIAIDNHLKPTNLFLRLQLYENPVEIINIKKLLVKKSKEGYNIFIDKGAWKSYISKNNEIEIIGARGVQFNLPFDRIHILYDDLDLTEATRRYNPLINNPELRKEFFYR